MKTLISSKYGLTISGHVTVLRQWLSEKNTDYIINNYIDSIYFLYLSAGGLGGGAFFGGGIFLTFSLEFGFDIFLYNPLKK